MLERREVNAGRDPFPKLVRKCKLPDLKHCHFDHPAAKQGPRSTHEYVALLSRSQPLETEKRFHMMRTNRKTQPRRRPLHRAHRLEQTLEVTCLA